MRTDLWQLLENAKADFGDRRALIDGTTELSWSGVHGSCVRLAALLSELGVQEHDRVAILSRNRAEYLCTYFAVAGIRAILVPINTRWTSREIDKALADCGARLLLIEARFEDVTMTLSPSIERVRIDDMSPRFLFEQPASFDIDAPAAETPSKSRADSNAKANVAQIYYTSGSTGRAKGVMLTHENVVAHAHAAVGELEIDSQDVWGHYAPMFHLADAWATFAVTAVGGTHVFLAEFEPAAALACIRAHEVTLTNLVPTMLGMMVAHEDARTFDYPSLRLLLSGGAPIAPAVVRRVVESFECEYVQTYGMTETSPYLTMSLLSDAQRRLPVEEQLRIRARTGRAFRGTCLRVVDSKGHDVPRDDEHVGEIQVRGPHVTPGYWNAPTATREAFTADGFLKTGDLATIDASGSVNIVDRMKDTILTGGETVYSTEVENRLYEHPAILEAAVFGVPDPVWGERVTAAIVLRSDADSVTEGELRDFCRHSLAGYKAPKSVHVLRSLPRTGSGKISKRQLRESFDQ